MFHGSVLIATIVIGLVLAFVLGAIANRLRVSPIVGYLLAGVAVGPYTPGFVADQDFAGDLAEIGVILLMFGVGLHFSLKELLSVRNLAVPGALLQIVGAAGMGMGLGWALGWTPGAGLVLGLALSVASTIVLTRALQERRLLETRWGHISVGWLIVEDLVMVLVLVLLPPLAGVLKGAAATGPSGSELGLAILVTVGKIAAFIALMLVVGRRAIPWLLHHIAHTGSRELFRLAVLAVALGVAYVAALLFGASIALGAFIAGMVMSESNLSQQAAEELLPLRDAFAVLFFVSVGMLFDPAIVIEHPAPLAAALAIVLVGRPAIAYGIVKTFRHTEATALNIGTSRAQIGEFSFILAGLGVAYGILPPFGRDIVLAVAMVTILVNPLSFPAAERIRAWRERRAGAAGPSAPAPPPAPEDVAPPLPQSVLEGHIILVGYGRVGRLVGEACVARAIPHLVIEEKEELLAMLAADGVETLPAAGATAAELLAAANVGAARTLFVAIPNSFEAGQYVEQARAANPSLLIVARAHHDDEVTYLAKLGADDTIMGEREIARAMIARALDPPSDVGDGDAGQRGEAGAHVGRDDVGVG